ncbi:helix-hairpin-helix domain-containing protein [Thalassospira sp. CH_XMU1448-2]|uniref:helix-hairpin-helix domain-containing protein n=1 Tax=Thalassospira sp. CH_XMU1448-2 TaxID=3107773 RepID=UPI00300938B3
MNRFSYIAAHGNQLEIEHLQLDQKTTDHLKALGIYTIAELSNFLEHTNFDLIGIQEPMDTLLEATSERGIDWFSYWEKRNFIFHHLFLTCDELANFDSEHTVCKIDKRSFGNAGVMLARCGIDTLGTLAEKLRTGLPNIAGLGATKKEELFHRLVEIVRDLRSGRISQHDLENLFPIQEEERTDTISLRQFKEPALSLEIGILHLGAKTQKLRTEGYITVEDLILTNPENLLSIPSMGKSTVKKIQESLLALRVSQDSIGTINWDVYCKTLNIPLLPETKTIEDGNTFLNLAVNLIKNLGETLGDHSLQKIIHDRICPQIQDRKTLESVGTSLTPPITRERIRQKEEKLLTSLASALIHDDYSTLRVHFRPEFSDFWKRAADYFLSYEEEITFKSLVEGLLEIWGPEKLKLLESLPSITAIITGEVTTFGEASKLAPELFTLPNSTRKIPLRHLQLGRSARALGEQGIETLGDLITKVLNGEAKRTSGVNFRKAIDHLDIVANCLGPDKTFSWERYKRTTNVISLPTKDDALPSDFFCALTENISEILLISPPAARSREVFELRTCRPLETRLTLESVAGKLQTYQPVISRTETETLAYLSEIILGEDFSLAALMLKPNFLSMWHRVHNIYKKAEGDDEAFKSSLAIAFEVAPSIIDKAIPTLIAIFTGYAHGRLTRHETKLRAQEEQTHESAQQDEQELTQFPTRVKLRGFRRLH